MSIARRILVAVLAVAALLAALLLVSVQYGVASEYGAGPGTTLLPLSVVPILVGVLATGAAGSRRALVALVAFSLVTVAACAVAAPLGQRTRDRLAVAADAVFGCNGPHSELAVPDAVDAAWDDFDHPYLLYGPVSASRHGCTAAIDGPAAETWEAWRRSLLDSGWSVERDDASEVAVTDGTVRAVLTVQGGLSSLTLSSAWADPCEAGGHRGSEDGRVSAC